MYLWEQSCLSLGFVYYVLCDLYVNLYGFTNIHKLYSKLAASLKYNVEEF